MGKVVIKTILAPVDFSDPGVKALTYAAQMAALFDATVVMAYVVEPVPMPAEISMAAVYDPDIETRALERLEVIGETHFADCRRETPVILRGHAGTELVRCADEQSADLIVLGTHGYSGLKHMLLGSTAEYVVRSAHCPVLTIRYDD
ncbi:MAG: universal stress protein [Gammaproteobacteria bacterium]|nr:MAG: universal stress protein [Gammaproteobacteria bacterium]RLA13510.1 MAG: universal stress protein [Gammaproteobacteria bacterium]